MAETPRAVLVTGGTGCPRALASILRRLPTGFTTPMLVVAHLESSFVAGLAAWLDQETSRTVQVGLDGQRIQPGNVYLAPDDAHLLVGAGARLQTARTAPISGYRPSATNLFSSAAEVYGPAAIGVVLSGLGQDGLAGARLLHEAGAQILVQDRASSQVYGMPAAVREAGLASEALPVDRIASRLTQLVAAPIPRAPSAPGPGDPSGDSTSDEAPVQVVVTGDPGTRDLAAHLAHPGLEVVESSAAAVPDPSPLGVVVVLVDRVDGLGAEAARAIRRVEGAAGPLVLATASPSREVTLLALEVGADALLTPPLDDPDLGLRVLSVYEAHRNPPPHAASPAFEVSLEGRTYFLRASPQRLLTLLLDAPGPPARIRPATGPEALPAPASDDDPVAS